jgi:membrane protease YdiL (CAAX protease family)
MDEATPAQHSSQLEATADTAIPPSDPVLRKIFLGRDGLRSGWRLLLYALMVVALGWGLGAIVRAAPKPSQLWTYVIGESLGFVAVVVPAVVMARIEKRPFGSYGLPRVGAFGKLFWMGMLWGIVALTVLMLGLRGAHAFYFGGLSIHGTRALEFALFWAGFFLIVSFFEDFMSRGYTQFTLGQGIGFWPAAILLSLAFGAMHLGNKGEDRIGALSAAMIGLFFCLTLLRTGNLWFAVGFHTSWDWGETYLYSVPNSGTVTPGHLLNSSFHGSHWLTGGSVGPEGSVLVFVVIALTWIAFHQTYPEVKYPTGKRRLATPA